VAVASLSLGAGLASGIAGAASPLARVVIVSPSSTFHVNRANGDYSGKMILERIRAGLGGGAVPRGMATAARNACSQIDAVGHAKDLYPYVRLLWYRGSDPTGALANFGEHLLTSTAPGTGRLMASTALDTNGDKFIATGGFWDSNLNYVQEEDDTATSYKGSNSASRMRSIPRHTALAVLIISPTG
jgi:hypothetical protein